MQDREIVAAIVAGQPGGLAAAYDRYGQPLHAYCGAMLGEPSAAAGAVQDTFVIAAVQLGGLRDPDRLRPWLYAVARSECHRRLGSRGTAAPLSDAGEMADDEPDVGVAADQAELRQLVRSALAGLNPAEREIIELNLRHELDGDELAAVLGVPRNQADALASRARTQFGTALGALLVARTGQPERREQSPAALLSLLPAALLPIGLRRELFRLVADRSPVAAEQRDRLVQRAGPWRLDGFPAPAGRLPPARRTFSRAALLTGAAAVAVLVLGGGAVLAANLLDHGSPGPAALAVIPSGGGGPAGGPLATGPASPGSSRKHDPSTLHPSASTQATVPGGRQPAATSPATAHSASPRPSASRSRSPSPPPSPSPASPSPGTLAASPAQVRLTQPAQGGPYTGSFTLTASGGPVRFSITDSVPASELSISATSGSLAAGKSVTITLSAPATGGPPAYKTPLTVDPGALTVAVYYPPSG